MTTSYSEAALSLERTAASVVDAYKRGLHQVHSPLVGDHEAWLKARHQAQSILRDCVAALRGEELSSRAEMLRYSRRVAVDRVKQGIAVSESIRAVEVLWEAMRGALRAAIMAEEPEKRAWVELLVTAAFRSSAGTRLYAGALAYEDIRARVSAQMLGSGEIEGIHPGPPAGEGKPLSRREMEVLAGVERAMSNAEIARELGIAPATVKRHLFNIYAKLGAASRIDAVNKSTNGSFHSLPALPKTVVSGPFTPTSPTPADSQRIAST